MDPGQTLSKQSGCHVLVDFDGTIATCDVTDFLLERFALPQWHSIEQEWQDGLIGSLECLQRQTALLRATPQELDAAIDEIEIDAGFVSFLRLCGEHAASVSIVSDGYDYVIARILQRYDISLPFSANGLAPDGPGRWRLRFPHARESCRVRAGHCKCATAEVIPKRLSVVVGDGRSDYCVARTADLVIAKSRLLELCRSGGVEAMAFADFYDVTAHLENWLALQDAPRDAVAGSRTPPL